jgi:hypothetical protein
MNHSVTPWVGGGIDDPKKFDCAEFHSPFKHFVPPTIFKGVAMKVYTVYK